MIGGPHDEAGTQEAHGMWCVFQVFFTLRIDDDVPGYDL